VLNVPRHVTQHENARQFILATDGRVPHPLSLSERFFSVFSFFELLHSTLTNALFVILRQSAVSFYEPA
jgi:hypothetical protein